MREYTILHCGTLFDGRNKVLRRNWDILVRDGEICEVSPDVQMPEGAKTVDLTDFVVFY